MQAGESQPTGFAADAALLNDYISEMSEILERLEAELVAGCTAPPGADSLSSIYRGLHTVKGLSATFGFETIVRLAHAAEDLVKFFKESSQSLPDDTCELLLQAVDQLRLLQPDDSGQVSNQTDLPILDELKDHGEALRAGTGDSHKLIKHPAPSQQGTTGREVDSVRQDSAIRVRSEDLEPLLEAIGLGCIYCDSLQEGLRVIGTLVSPDVRAHLMRVLAGPLEGLERVLKQSQEQGEFIRTVPVKRIFRKVERAAWEVAKRSGKQIRLDLQDNDIRLDQAVLGDISGPLMHIIRNAVDHGLELPDQRQAAGKDPCGLVTLTCQAEQTQISFEIRDDGAGIDLHKVAAKAVEKGLLLPAEAQQADPKQLTDLIFLPSFSTAERVTETSGRGVGMDVVANTVRRLGGRAEVTTDPGAGSRFVIHLPRVSVSAHSRLLEVLLVQHGAHILALPSQNAQVIAESPDGSSNVLVAPNGSVVPRISLADLLALDRDQGAQKDRRTVLFVHCERGQAGLEVTGVPLPARVLPVPLAELGISAWGIQAAAILPAGELCLIVDPEQLIDPSGPPIDQPAQEAKKLVDLVY